MNEALPAGIPVVSENYRRLRFNELVKRGDYVEDGHQGFEPWVGPAGFSRRFVRQNDLSETDAPAQGGQTGTVNTLQVIWLTILKIPRAIVGAFRERPEREPGPKELEAERLDRIRNPSKYLGK